jgi:hypothetical protein
MITRLTRRFERRPLAKRILRTSCGGSVPTGGAVSRVGSLAFLQPYSRNRPGADRTGPRGGACCCGATLVVMITTVTNAMPGLLTFLIRNLHEGTDRMELEDVPVVSET